MSERRDGDCLEVAYWNFDARRAGTYKRDPHGVLGPQAERDAFKAAVREHIKPTPTRSTKLRDELVALTVKWRGTRCASESSDDYVCDWMGHDTCCPLRAIESDMTALVDALAIAEREEQR